MLRILLAVIAAVLALAVLLGLATGTTPLHLLALAVLLLVAALCVP